MNQDNDILDAQQAKKYYTNHPYGKRIVDYLIDMANIERSFSMGSYSEGILVFKEISLRTSQNEAVREACKQALIFGECTLYVVIESDDKELSDISKPLLYHKIKPSDKIRFLCAYPIIANSTTEQNPLNINFMRKTNINVNGTSVHPSRAIVLRYGMPLYLAFTNSAFQFTGRSIYQNCAGALDTLTLLDNAQTRVANQIGLIIHGFDTHGSAGSEVIGNDNLQDVIQAKAQQTNYATTNNTLAIPNADNISYLESSSAAQAVSTMRVDLLKRVSSGTSVPYQELVGESYSSNLSEGSSDFKLAQQKLTYIQNTILKMAYDFTDKIILGILQNSLEERESGNEVMSSFIWTWGEFTKPDAGELLDKEIKIAELNFKLYEITGDKESFIEAMNDLQIITPSYKMIKQQEEENKGWTWKKKL